VRKVNYFVATFFYCGYFPIAPGTFASLIAGLIGYLFLTNFSLFSFVIFFLLITVAGFVTSGAVAEYEGKKDPSIVVVDEASGIIISMLIVSLFYQNHLINLILSFLFFRLYDISKIFPVNKMEKINGGSGIMLDDIVAGMMAALSVLAMIFISGKIG